MEWIFRALLLCLTAGVFATVIQRTAPEIALALGAVAALLVLMLSFRFAESVIRFLEELSRVCGLSAVYTQPLLKCFTISLITKLGTELCRDGKQNGAAAALQFLGAAASVWTCLPLMETFLSMLERAL